MHANTQKVIIQYSAKGNRMIDSMASEIAEAREILKQVGIAAKHTLKTGTLSNGARDNVRVILDNVNAYFLVHGEKR